MKNSSKKHGFGIERKGQEGVSTSEKAGSEKSLRRKKIRSRPEEPISMPDGSGAVILMSKQGGKLNSVAVVALRSVPAELANSSLWTILSNVLMPHQLSFDERPVWTDLTKYRAYNKEIARAKKADRLNRKKAAGR